MALASLAAATPPRAAAAGAVGGEADDRIVVAVRSAAEAAPSVGGTPRAADGARYAGGDRAAALASALAREHGLVQQTVWTIVPLQWRCMVYRLAVPSDRARVLAELQRDPRVALAQPLNEFTTQTETGVAYNDPYVGLQHGFATLDAAGAQRVTRGASVSVAVIDTAVDAGHPDLEGRVERQRDFVTEAPTAASTASRLHGTQVAGVIAAGANNGIGIVGIAPLARLQAYRACWPRTAAVGGGSVCNTLTLAQALVAAIEHRADVINLSLGGPADPLLARLAARAMAGGAIVVGAAPPGGTAEGFPSGVPGVLSVASAEAAAGPPADGALAAPGRDILTLAPGGGYDYASGTSLAAAHVSGAVALLRALQPSLGAPEAARLLGATAHGSIDVCAAVRRLRPATACGSSVAP